MCINLQPPIPQMAYRDTASSADNLVVPDTEATTGIGERTAFAIILTLPLKKAIVFHENLILAKPHIKQSTYVYTVL